VQPIHNNKLVTLACAAYLQKQTLNKRLVLPIKDEMNSYHEAYASHQKRKNDLVT
jgi:hypothetical protein